MGKKDETSSPAGGHRLTPLDIQQKEFGVSRLGGYRMRDVDEYLDELTESVADVMAELEQLRALPAQGPVLGAPDLDDVSRQADEIIQRARDEAGRIVADAHERAANAGGSSAVDATAGAGDAGRAAVDAFLRQEREFLQSLAALVQGHAESVKGMARKARSVSAPPPPAGDVSVEEPDETPVPETVAQEPEARPEAERKKPDDPPLRRKKPEGDVTQVMDAPNPPIRVEEPEPAATSAERGETDPTLRELFWGEEN